VPRVSRAEAGLATWLAAALAEPWKKGVGARLARVGKLDESRFGEHAVAVPVYGAGWTAAVVLSGGLGRFWAADVFTDRLLEIAAPRPLTLAERGVAPLLVAFVADEASLSARIGEAGGVNAVRGWVGDALSAELAVTVGDRQAPAWIVASAEAIQRMPRRPAPDGLAIEVEVAVEVGRVSVTHASLAALERRDVVICRREEPRLSVARGGFPVALGDWRGGGLRVEVTGPYRAQGANMDPVLAADLPVELALELGRVKKSAAEVLALAPGAVIALDRPVAALVDLVAGGRVVARGELVDVDGAIGVRVTELSR
jgi:flagellar motor switch/type III secretory pathway protein FliN